MPPTSAGKRSDWSLYKRTLAQARGYWLHLAGVLVLGALATPLGLLSPLPLKIAVDSALGSHPLPRMLDALLPGSGTRSVIEVLILAVILVIAIALLSQLQALATSLLGVYTAEKLVLNFRARLFEHIQRLSVSYHDVKGSADSIYRIQNDAAAIQYIVIDGLVPLVSSILMLAGMIYVTARIDWQLMLLAIAVAPLLVGLNYGFRPLLRDRYREVKVLESSSLAIIQEALSALRVVKAFSREDHEQDRFVRRSAEGMRARIRVALVEGRFGLLVGLATALGTAAVLWTGVRHVLAGALTLGDMLLVIAYLGQLLEPLKTIGKKAASIQGHLASIERAFLLLDEVPGVLERANARPLSRANGSIVYRNVEFGYPNGPTVLQGVSFEVPAGARVGIAGRTGAGKSTLISLLARFYDPTSGEILLDGEDLRNYKLKDLRNQYAIVLQEPVLFSTSIAENIGYAKAGAAQEEIVEAAKLANAHDFVSRLPDGYDTLVGERGMRLSGGERQRISLARAFLKNAPILILDEPTSSVDLKTEAGILDAIERLMKGRTTFIIAHRLNTLEGCDVRLQVENGRLLPGLATEPSGSKA